MQANKVARKEGAQTLVRGLVLLESVAQGIHDLESLAQHTELTRSTVYRLLDTLAQAGYLRHIPRRGYYLGPRIIQLGFRAYDQLHLPSIAHAHLEWLAEATQEVVHLGILDGNEIVYIDKVQGNRDVQIVSYIGARFPAQSTALGKALISSLPEQHWLNYFVPGLQRTPNTISDAELFVAEIARTRERGYALDREENKIGIRCIAAPVRDGGGQGIAAVSIASAALYVDEKRIEKLIPLVQNAAQRISQEVGWSEG